MLAIARALMAKPRLLLLVEPSMGSGAVDRPGAFRIRERDPVSVGSYDLPRRAERRAGAATGRRGLRGGERLDIVVTDTADAVWADPRIRAAYLGETESSCSSTAPASPKSPWLARSRHRSGVGLFLLLH
jgi:hypothetical protein